MPHHRDDGNETEDHPQRQPFGGGARWGREIDSPRAPVQPRPKAVYPPKDTRQMMELLRTERESSTPPPRSNGKKTDKALLQKEETVMTFPHPRPPGFPPLFWGEVKEQSQNLPKGPRGPLPQGDTIDPYTFPPGFRLVIQSPPKRGARHRAEIERITILQGMRPRPGAFPKVLDLKIPPRDTTSQDPADPCPPPKITPKFKKIIRKKE